MTQYDEEVVNEKVIDREALAIITSSVLDGHGNGLITIDNRQINRREYNRPKYELCEINSKENLAVGYSM